jgi:hypothetical protein
MVEVNLSWIFRPRPDHGQESGDQANRGPRFEGIGEAIAEFTDVIFIDVVDAKIKVLSQTLIKADTVTSEEARTGDRFPDVFHGSPPHRHLAVFMQQDMQRPGAHILQMWLFVNLPLPVLKASLPYQHDVSGKIGPRSER